MSALTPPLPSSHRASLYVTLFAASLLGLYFEIMIVRWLAAEVRLFSYFKNLSLMAAFIGFGIGFALAGRGIDSRRHFAPLLVAYVVLVIIISRLTGFRALIIPEGSEYIWRPATQLSPVVSVVAFGLIIILLFSLTVALMVPLGQLTGRLMIGLPPTPAYMVNILGSLAGIWLFSVVSYLHWPPWAWFGLSLTILLWLIRRERNLFLAGAAFIVVALLFFTQGQTSWSPYYRIDIAPLDGEGDPAELEQAGYHLFVNQVGHMEAVDLSTEFLASHPGLQERLHAYQTLYNLPYALVKPRSVLIVGAGMGNDVAAALRHGVGRVDAVEIDPLIFDFGKRLHPEQPYASPQVRVFIDDARSFLEKSDAQYDLIVFGILDSQTMLSGMSSIRLDNFVYTVESLQTAQKRLSPGGVIALTFDVERPWIKQRLAEIMTSVFKQPPLQLSIAATAWTTYLSGGELGLETASALCRQLDCVVESTEWATPLPMATDDWPYLYLERRAIPTPYWIVLLIVLAVSWLSIRSVVSSGSRRLNIPFFLLGGAFLLMEFKIVTELALLFGSTWIVNVIAITAVLLMALLANLLVGRTENLNLHGLFLVLAISLVAGYFFPLQWLLPYSLWQRALFSILLMGTPLFLASSIFAISLRRSESPVDGLSSNFLGSAVGGVLEYGSLAFGIGSLYLIALGLFAAAWIAGLRQRP